jgi:16S rRNA G966 N2-methylase RsmD
MTHLATNVLYYGDNLDILRRYLPAAAVDLVYLDPPFNSNRDTTSSSATSRARQAMPSCWPSRTPGTGVHRPMTPADADD